MNFAAVEGGGTSWVAAFFRHDEIGSLEMIERAEFVTETPETTLSRVREFLRSKSFSALGVASFGPIDCKKSSPTFGFITSTPKPGWRNTDVLRLLGVYEEFQNIPFSFDTDVNAPAFAEYKLHSKQNQTSLAYITVGTGIGVGLVVNGATVHGLLHPEAGHVQAARISGDNFTGTCPFHGCCIEGMCSSGALSKRKNCKTEDLPSLSDDDEIWDIAAHYLGQLCATLILIASPEQIVIGGGVLNRMILFEKIREQTRLILNEYLQNDSITDARNCEYIRASHWSVRKSLIIFAKIIAYLFLRVCNLIDLITSGGLRRVSMVPPISR
jgi:fructokinase